MKLLMNLKSIGLAQQEIIIQIRKGIWRLIKLSKRARVANARQLKVLSVKVNTIFFDQLLTFTR